MPLSTSRWASYLVRAEGGADTDELGFATVGGIYSFCFIDRTERFQKHSNICKRIFFQSAFKCIWADSVVQTRIN